MLKVVAALEATTDTEYRRKVSELAVTVRRFPDKDARGRSGVSAEYLLDGVVRARTFSRAGYHAAGTGGNSDSEGEGFILDEGGSALPFEPEYAVSTVGLAGVVSSTTCSYTDPDNVYWSGECATQQQIDDAWAVALSIEADANGIQAETNAFSYSYCQSYPTDCWEQEEMGASVGGPSECVGHSRSTGPCYSAAIGYASSLVNFAYRFGKLVAAVSVAAPPAAPILEAIYGGVMAGAFVAATGMTLHYCLLK